MESNEQTYVTSKTERDSQMESSRQLVWGGEVRGSGVEQKGKRTPGHGQVLIAGGRGA